MSILNGETMKKLGTAVNENLPHIFTGIGVIGVFTTSAETAKAVQKVKEIDASDLDGQTASEKSKAVIKAWFPAILSGILTIGSIISSDVVHTRRYSSLLGAYMLAKSELPKYKKKVEEMVGEQKATEIEESVKEEQKTQNPTTALVHMHRRYKVVDNVTGHSFTASQMALLRAEKEVSVELARDGSCTLAHFYYEAADEAETPEIADRIYWDQYSKFDTMNLIIETQLDNDGEVYLTIDYEYNMR